MAKIDPKKYAKRAYCLYTVLTKVFTSDEIFKKLNRLWRIAEKSENDLEKNFQDIISAAFVDTVK